MLGSEVMNSNESLTAEHSLAQNGKSFHWARRFLGAQAGRDAAQLYSYCRILDDMADGDIVNGPKRLKNVRNGLINSTTTGDPLLPDLHAFILSKDLSCEIVLALIDGLLQDQTKVALSSERSLLRYGYRVAGTVGLMMSTILGCYDSKALKHAIDLGIAMQLTNIARDVLEDAQMGRRYLPSEWVEDMTADQIIELAHAGPSTDRDLISGAVARLLGLAEMYYVSGMQGLVYLPLRAHLAIAVAAQVYRQIGLQIVAKGCCWYKKREFTSNSTKLACTFISLKSLPLRFRKYPTHKKELHIALSGLPNVK